MKLKQSILPIILVCGFAIATWLTIAPTSQDQPYCFSRDEAFEKQAVERSKSTTTSQRFKLTRPLQMRGNLNAAKAPLSRDNVTPLEDAPRYDNSSMSMEEHFRLAERKRKIEPFLLDKSPELLQEILDEQNKDLHWTHRVEYYLTNVLEADQFKGSDVLEIDCRMTLCKLVVHHDTNSDFEMFRDNAATTGILDTDQHGKPIFHDDGTVETTVYFSREGGDPGPFMEMHERLSKWVDAQQS